MTQKRAAADRLEQRVDEAYQRSPGTTDRSAYWLAQIAALETEIRVRDSIEIFLLATDRHSAAQREKARAALLQVELDERARLGIEDSMPVPIAALQCLPAWHTARRRVAQFECGDSSGTQREHAAAGSAASALLKKLQSQLAVESKRLADAEILRQRSAADTERVQAPWDDHRRAAEVRDDRVDALLV